MGKVDLEERVARLEAELSFLKWQSRTRNDSLLSRMARRWTNLEYLVLSPRVIPAQTQNATIYNDREGSESADNLNILSNGIPSSSLPNSPYVTQIDATQPSWRFRMGPGADSAALQRMPAAGSLIDLIDFPANGNLSLKVPNAVLTGEYTANGIDYGMMKFDTGGNLLLGPSNLTPSKIIVQNDFLDVAGISGTNGGIRHKIKAGALTDADFTNPASGLMGIDVTNSKIYVRIGTTWKSVGVA